jgi:hypothetical protein
MLTLNVCVHAEFKNKRTFAKNFVIRFLFNLQKEEYTLLNCIFGPMGTLLLDLFLKGYLPEVHKLK